MPVLRSRSSLIVPLLAMGIALWASLGVARAASYQTYCSNTPDDPTYNSSTHSAGMTWHVTCFLWTGPRTVSTTVSITSHIALLTCPAPASQPGTTPTCRQTRTASIPGTVVIPAGRGSNSKTFTYSGWVITCQAAMRNWASWALIDSSNERPQGTNPNWSAPTVRKC